MELWKKDLEFNKAMNQVEKDMKEIIKSRQPLVQKAVLQLTEAGGKRLRPALVLLSHDFGERINPNIHKVAAAVEIIHMATLVHDDIIDDASTRRGQITTQAKWGKNVAVFTGDYLISKAFLSLSKNVLSKDISKVSFMAKSICEGEIEQFDSRFKTDVTLKQYLWRIKCKTAHLFAFSCWLGAVEADASKNIINALKRYGNNLGMAFQISDDILDFIGNEEKVGKPLGSDIKNGIYTLPIIYALTKGKKARALKELLLKGDFSQEEIKTIIEMTIENGGLLYAKKLLEKYIKKAKKDLEKAPEGPYKKTLYQLVDQISGREY